MPGSRGSNRGSVDGHEHWLNWVLRAVDDDALIGFVQATVLADGRAWIAYVIGSAYWGRGLASEATAAMLDVLAASYRFSEFLAVLKRDNRRSLRLLERFGFVPASVAALAAHPVRLGFVREGFLRERWIVDGEVSDSALYGLRQRDWRARAAPHHDHCDGPEGEMPTA